MNAISQFGDPAFCITRLSVGLMFACHGGQKILGFPPRGHGMPTETLGIIGALIELATGFTIALGFLARIAAFIASGEMAVGYFIAHAPGGFFSIQNRGEPAVFYCWLFFFVVFYGPGRWSVDALLSKRRPAATSAVASIRSLYFAINTSQSYLVSGCQRDLVQLWSPMRALFGFYSCAKSSPIVARFDLQPTFKSAPKSIGAFEAHR